jgi:hypothetical protein
MPAPEREGGHPERPTSKEQEPSPYYQASRYRTERPALTAYNQAQKVIYGYRGDVDLSAYRFLLHRLSHVAVVGSQPPDELDQSIKQILSSGESVSLPDDVLRMLLQRRAHAQQVGPWVEGHYRPGIRVYPPENKPE